MESASNINIFEFSSLFSVSIVLRLILFVYYLVAIILFCLFLQSWFLCIFLNLLSLIFFKSWTILLTVFIFLFLPSFLKGRDGSALNLDGTQPLADAQLQGVSIFFIFLFRNKNSYIILIYFKQNSLFIYIVVFYSY